MIGMMALQFRMRNAAHACHGWHRSTQTLSHPLPPSLLPLAAAGFADGLGRGATLVVGDLSFLHDINGLNLLRSGACARGRVGCTAGHCLTGRATAAAFASSDACFCCPRAENATLHPPTCPSAQARPARR